MIIRLKKFAKKYGMSYKALWDRFHRGTLPGGLQDTSGNLFVDEGKYLKSLSEKPRLTRKTKNKLRLK